MNRHLFGLAVVLCSVLALPSVGMAQPDRGTVFITGSGFAAIERAPTFGGLGITGSDASGTVPGGALGLGVHLTERISARFEWSMTDTLTHRQSIPAFQTTTLSGGLFGTVPTTSSLVSITQSFETKRTTSAGFALLGYHVGTGRASLELLGGLGLLNEDIRTRSSFNFPTLPGFQTFALPSVDNKSSTNTAVAVMGADVTVSLTDRAAIVPQIRGYASNGRLSVRPGLALRWTF